jgi:NADH-quinone oxidoreductase subunit H
MPAAPAAPAAPKPAPKPKVVIPDPVLNETQGRLLVKTRYWPTEKWADPWSDPGYRKAAAILTGIILGGAAIAAAIGELAPWVQKIHSLLEHLLLSHGLPQLGADIVWTVLKLIVLLHIPLINGPWLIWWERKISAHMQSRLGPMYVGGWHGWLQTVADGLKLLLKEDITPYVADAWVHRLAPAVVVVPSILAFAVVPFGQGLTAADLDMSALYVLAMAGVSVIGIMMAGWGSGNKYSVLGGLRSAAQLVSYELPRTFSIVPVLMLAGTLSLTGIADAQQGYWLGILPKWFIFYPVVGQLGFLIFLTASVAETNRVPFDIPEAESELVAGFHTEYAGMKWSLFFLAEYSYVLLACVLATVFFLGGGAAPLPFLSRIPTWFWYLAKALVLQFCFLWFRWTFPRFRVDRLMDFCWKFLLPWSLANILFAGAYLW